MTELDDAADVSRDGIGSMRGIDPIHFPERVGDFDHDRVVAAVREILIGIGEDPDRNGLRDTPERVARAYAEMFGGLRENPEKVLATVFDLGHDELVLVKQIPATKLSGYAPLVNDLDVNQTPSVVVIDRDGQARAADRS